METDTREGKVSNEKIMNNIIMGIASTPAGADDAEEEQSKIPSKRRRLEFLKVPETTGIRNIKQMENKMSIIRFGHPSKKDWATITRKLGKYNKRRKKIGFRLLISQCCE